MPGYKIDGEQLKGVPRGFDPDHPRADLLRFKSLYAASSGIEPAVLATPELIDVVANHCQKMAPVQQWLVKVRAMR